MSHGSVVIREKSQTVAIVIESSDFDPRADFVFVMMEDGKTMTMSIREISILEADQWPCWVNRIKSGNDRIKAVRFNESLLTAIQVDSYRHDGDGFGKDVEDFVNGYGTIDVVEKYGVTSVEFTPQSRTSKIGLGDWLVRMGNHLVIVPEEEFEKTFKLVEFP